MKFKTFKEWLADKGVDDTAYSQKTATEMAQLQKEYLQYVSEEIKKATESGVTKNTLDEAIKNLVASDDIKGMMTKDSQEFKDLEKRIGEAEEKAAQALERGRGIFGDSFQKELNDFIEKNFDEIKRIKAQGSGVIEFESKAVGSMTTGSATNPDGIPALTGVQMAPPSNVNLRTSNLLALTSNVNTSLAAYPYTESVPKDGDYAFVAEGASKSQIDFKIETRYAQPVKMAAWMKLTDESVQDIPGLQSIAWDYLRKKHDLKKLKGILFGNGISPNPKGATEYARAFVAGDMATAIDNPTIMDVINAAATDIFTTHNYEDETEYMPSLAVLHPVDFFVQFVAAKDGGGKPLYPTASLFNMVNIGGMTIIPERSIEKGHIFIADMSKYNTTNYLGYTVKIGWVNDDFIKNQFVIIGESRFHAFVKKLDEQAFIYDEIDVIATAIATVAPAQ